MVVCDGHNIYAANTTTVMTATNLIVPGRPVPLIMRFMRCAEDLSDVEKLDTVSS